MAYTDFVNVAAPSNWDEAQSGFLLSNWASGINSQFLAQAVTKIDAPLSTYWDGAEYNTNFNGRAVLLVLPTAVSASQLWVMARTDQSYSGLWVYGPDGELMFGGPLTSTYDDANAQGDSVYLYPFDFPEERPVKAILFADPNGYSQGNIYRLLGVYGTLLAGDPPPPPPFWREFVKTSERI